MSASSGPLLREHLRERRRDRVEALVGRTHGLHDRGLAEDLAGGQREEAYSLTLLRSRKCSQRRELTRAAISALRSPPP
jgi:hypothetical protein